MTCGQRNCRSPSCRWCPRDRRIRALYRSRGVLTRKRRLRGVLTVDDDASLVAMEREIDALERAETVDYANKHMGKSPDREKP